MGRAPCCDKVGLKRGPWTPEEDQVLISFIQQYGHSNWRALPKQAGLLRCGKSCRLRWINYLRPDIKRGNFSKEEEDTIIQLHEMMGNRWSAIAARLPGRTDNEIKNVWHTHLKRRLDNKQFHHRKQKSSQTKVAQKHSDHDANNVTTSNSSPRSYSSDDFSSLTDVSSAEVPNNKNNTVLNAMENAERSVDDDDDEEYYSGGLDDYFPIIDETFWSSQELTDDGINMDNVFSDIIDIEDDSVQEINQSYQEEINLVGSSKSNSMISIIAQLYSQNGSIIEKNNYGSLHRADSMDFSLDVFVRAGGAPDLPEF